MYDIEISDFTKNYSTTRAVDNISMKVKRGELFGLIGPDGSGKTTLMRTLATLLFPTSGTVTIRNMDITTHITEIRAILGYMPQRFSLYQDLTVEQNLHFFADLFQVPDRERPGRLEQLYHFSRLGAFVNRKAGALSGGMKQKLALSCALIHTPDVLLLDEPTFGVDPVSREEFWNILHIIKEQGTTILASTAYMDEANQCDRVALLFNGRIRALDTPENLRKKYPHPLYLLEDSDLRKLNEHLRDEEQIHSIQLFGDTLHVSFYKDPDSSIFSEIARKYNKTGLRWQKIPPSVEDIFLSLMEEKQ
jgi:ABC-type multidrug transport system ATPase subunit